MKLWSEIILSEPDTKSENNKKADIVFIHGTGSNSRMWKKQVDHFRRLGHNCVLIDLRGHGFTHEPYEKTSVETHINDVLQTLGTTQINFPAYFVGHSLGAIISFHIAQRNPELVKGVFAACLPGKILKPLAKGFGIFIDGPMQNIKEKLKDSKVKERLGWRAKTLLEMTPFTLSQILLHLSDMDLISAKPKLHCPVHFSAGRFDPVAIHWHVHKMHRQIPNSTFKIFEWGGHNFMDYTSIAFNAWIEKYLE